MTWGLPADPQTWLNGRGGIAARGWRADRRKDIFTLRSYRLGSHDAVIGTPERGMAVWNGADPADIGRIAPLTRFGANRTEAKRDAGPGNGAFEARLGQDRQEHERRAGASWAH